MKVKVKAKVTSSRLQSPEKFVMLSHKFSILPSFAQNKAKHFAQIPDSFSEMGFNKKKLWVWAMVILNRTHLVLFSKKQQKIQDKSRGHIRGRSSTSRRMGAPTIKGVRTLSTFLHFLKNLNEIKENLVLGHPRCILHCAWLLHNVPSCLWWLVWLYFSKLLYLNKIIIRFFFNMSQFFYVSLFQQRVLFFFNLATFD